MLSWYLCLCWHNISLLAHAVDVMRLAYLIAIFCNPFPFLINHLTPIDPKSTSTCDFQQLHF